MKSGFLRADSRAVVVLTYLYQSDAESITARDAAQLMGVETKQVSSLLHSMIAKGAMLRTYYAGGLCFSLARGVSVEYEADGRWRYDYPTADEIASGQIDEVDDDDAPCQTWVPASGLPMPQTRAVRSVFELATAMEGA